MLVYVEKPVVRMPEKKWTRKTKYYFQSFEYISMWIFFPILLEDQKIIKIHKIGRGYKNQF